MNVQGEWLYNQHALQAYTTFCCQPQKGGLRDKPTKGPDPYHTMYGMAGNSVAQHKSDYKTLHANTEEARQFRTTFDGNYFGYDEDGCMREEEHEKVSILAGILDNKLRRINPIHNARFDQIEKAKAFFRA